MRKFKLLAMSLLLAGAAFTSCTKDDLLDAPEADKPVVTVKQNGVPVTSINTFNAGETVPVVVRFEMGGQKDRLEKIKITTLVQGQTFVVLDSVLNDGWFNRGDKFVERNYNIAVGQSISTITFETKDVKGRSGSTIITVAPKGTNIPADNEEREAVLLAGQLNISAEYGGFYSVAINKVFKLKDAVSNAPFVDFVYFYGDKNEATLAPISDPDLKLVAGIKELIDQFKVQNATSFARISSADYIAGKYPSTEFVAKGQNHLVIGDCLAFRTALGQKGLIKVIDIMGTVQEKRAIKILVKTVK